MDAKRGRNVSAILALLLTTGIGLACLGCGETATGFTLAEAETIRLCQYVSTLKMPEYSLKEIRYPRAQLKPVEAGGAPKGDFVREWYAGSVAADMRRQRATKPPAGPHRITEAEVFAWGDMRTWDLLETLADRQKAALLREELREEERRAKAEPEKLSAR
jgi:hypothetical protein